ncbi:hypothetical protein TNCT_375671 [Trichonephila clavata]|uniref:Uncharacterized protein n=1 Tax=Trichonephila clavata TaxID=2740835 RepID=A0A8X6KZ09_TRICU|nr:hypothetical protein TNCT_375671 [Trichonephila clavata]
MCSNPENMAAIRGPCQYPLGTPEVECGSQSLPGHQTLSRFDWVKLRLAPHELHHGNIKGTLGNVDEIIFQNLHILRCQRILRRLFSA